MIGILTRADLEGFGSFVAERFGLSFEDGKLDFLKDLACRRIQASGCERFSEYQQRVLSSPQELRALAEHLTVCETYFFRYAEHFRAFTQVVVPDRIRVRGHCRQLRILSAGCASGEEAYSLAILIRDQLPDLASWEIVIHGIDVNPSMVKKAMRACYHSWSLRDTPADLRSGYFRSEGREMALVQTVKSMATFEERNLVEEDPSFWRRDAFDVVFCRNVIMYFTLAAGGALIARIARSLTPGGFLFLGHAETLRGISQDFHLLHTHETFYYQLRHDEEARSSAISHQVSGGVSLFPALVPAPLETGNTWFDVIRRASERVTHLTNGKGNYAVAGSINAKDCTPISQANPDWDRKAAMELLQQEKFREAIELLRGLPSGPQAGPEAQLLLAVLLTNCGELAEAEKICSQLLNLDELNAGAHYLMALCREHVGDRKGAAEHDQAAIYLDSAFAMPHLHRGLLAKRSVDLETARRELGQALALLLREDASRILLFGGGFTREALSEFCRAELRACGGPS